MWMRWIWRLVWLAVSILHNSTNQYLGDMTPSFIVTVQPDILGDRMPYFIVTVVNRYLDRELGGHDALLHHGRTITLMSWGLDRDAFIASVQMQGIFNLGNKYQSYRYNPGILQTRESPLSQQWHLQHPGDYLFSRLGAEQTLHVNSKVDRTYCMYLKEKSRKRRRGKQSSAKVLSPLFLLRGCKSSLHAVSILGGLFDQVQVPQRYLPCRPSILLRSNTKQLENTIG